MGQAPFPLHPEYTAISIAYKNERLIADQVLRRVPVGKREFKYLVQEMSEAFKVPNTLVGRKSRPNEVDFSASERAGAVVDFGLEDPVPQDDIDNAPPNYDPLGRATEGLTDLILLGREVRAAQVVFNPATYPVANKKTLAGAAQWNDPASDPIKEIMDALDSMVMRANKMVIGRAAFSVLARHPKIVKAVLGNAGDSGVARRQDLAELLELQEVLVGEGWLDSAKKGQPAAMTRVWGKHCALIYDNPLADTQRGVTFGLTAEYGQRIAGTREDPDIGLRGGQRVRVGESVAELVTSSMAGFLLQDVAA